MLTQTVHACAGALPWLRDPFDPEFDPMQKLITTPVFTQIRQQLVATACLACTAVLVVHIPVTLARTLAPSLHPITLPPPTDMLLLNVVTPIAFPLLKLR